MSVNLAVVRGRISSAPDVRVLAGGRNLATLQVTVRSDAGPACSVPVTAWDPPGWVEDLATGDEVVALGRVRRRFYRAAGVTVSKVEVEAVRLVRGRDGRGLAAVQRRAQAEIDRLEP